MGMVESKKVDSPYIKPPLYSVSHGSCVTFSFNFETALNDIYLSRFGDLKLQNAENKAFAQHFQENYAGKILECHLNLLNAIRIGDYLPDRVTNLILQYLSNRSASYNL